MFKIKNRSIIFLPPMHVTWWSWNTINTVMYYVVYKESCRQVWHDYIHQRRSGVCRKRNETLTSDVLWPCRVLSWLLNLLNFIESNNCKLLWRMSSPDFVCFFVSYCIHCICCIIVSTVGWTWWDWSLILRTLSFFSALTLLIGSFDL